MGNLLHRSFSRPVWLSTEAANPSDTNIILLCHSEGGKEKQFIETVNLVLCSNVHHVDGLVHDYWVSHSCMNQFVKKIIFVQLEVYITECKLYIF